MFSKLKKIIPVRVRQKMRFVIGVWEAYKKYKIVSFFIEIIEAIIGRFLTIHTRPKYAKFFCTDTITISQDHSFYAVVVQGPVLNKSNFTLETLLLYKKHFNNALIILSTWEGENQRCVKAAMDAGIEVIVSKKPADAGPININLQIVSSHAGINRALQMNKKYILKTRTDQRINNPGALFFLSNLLTQFPVSYYSPDTNYNAPSGRLIGISANNSKKKLYHFPDQFVFGFAKDIEKYFSVGHASHNTSLSFLDSANPFTAEGYLLTEFLRSIGYVRVDTYDDYLRVLARFCLIVDTASIDWYWYKYRRFREYTNIVYKTRHVFIGFAEWFNLYSIYK